MEFIAREAIEALKEQQTLQALAQKYEPDRRCDSSEPGFRLESVRLRSRSFYSIQAVYSQKGRKKKRRKYRASFFQGTRQWNTAKKSGRMDREKNLGCMVVLWSVALALLWGFYR